MHPILVDIHSLLRYLLLIVILVSIFKSFSGWFGKTPYSKIDDKLSLYTLIFTHLQLVFGLILYFTSPLVKFSGDVMGDAVSRFWVVEHISVMLIGIALITIGRVKAKKLTEDVKKHKTTALYFLIGLILILSRIPWPFTAVSRPWF